MDRPKTTFSTRDLLMLAALAALGGMSSTYLNAVGDFFQSILGFARIIAEHGPRCLVCPETLANRWVFQLQEIQVNE